MKIQHSCKISLKSVQNSHQGENWFIYKVTEVYHKFGSSKKIKNTNPIDQVKFLKNVNFYKTSNPCNSRMKRDMELQFLLSYLALLNQFRKIK